MIEIIENHLLLGRTILMVGEILKTYFMEFRNLLFLVS